MPIITFIRHAETVYNDNKIFVGRIDCELSKKGIQDTIRKFDYKKDDFDIYYCSPLKRSIDTLNLIINNIDKINIDNRIIEIFIGDWEGKKKDDISQELVLNYRDGLYHHLMQKQCRKLIIGLPVLFLNFLNHMMMIQKFLL